MIKKTLHLKQLYELNFNLVFLNPILNPILLPLSKFGYNLGLKEQIANWF